MPYWPMFQNTGDRGKVIPNKNTFTRGIDVVRLTAVKTENKKKGTRLYCVKSTMVVVTRLTTQVLFYIQK